MRVTIEVTSVHKLYVVYSMERDDTIIYVGMCKWSQLLHTPDARQNSEFHRLTGSVTLEVLDYFASKQDAVRYWSTSVRTLKPVINRMGKLVAANRATIQCIDDGSLYYGPSEAARAYGVTAGAISNHLAGRPGYATVNGHKFRKVV